MIKDTEQCFEDLAKSYPELMEQSTIGESLGVDVGWYNIIDTLCGCIYAPVQSAKNRLKAATDYPRDETGTYLAHCQGELAAELEQLPFIVQIKEKFAGLRFYVEGGNERVSTLISFAERMSRCTCEHCGAPGELDDSTAWSKTRCESHAGSAKYSFDYEEGAVSAKFQDDEI